MIEATADAIAAESAEDGAAALVLASGSETRARLLRAAGVPVIVDSPGVDEAEVKLSLRAAGAPPGALTETLAEMKAQRVSRRHPGRIVIGADQVLACEGAWFDKPETLDAAAAQLRRLRGKRHELVSSVVALRDGTRLWHVTDTARLTMRAFGETFLETYLAQAGPAILDSVGAYRLEGPGAQLFSRIEGDYFTILGLPLLPLLDFLRLQGSLAT
jgi:septum formation protein